MNLLQAKSKREGGLGSKLEKADWGGTLTMGGRKSSILGGGSGLKGEKATLRGERKDRQLCQVARSPRNYSMGGKISTKKKEPGRQPSSERRSARGEDNRKNHACS